MNKVIVFLDDPQHAREQLRRPHPGAGTAVPAAATHWVLVACAPRMTHRISKWVSHSARENWRNKWAERLFEQVVPALQACGDSVTTVLAKGPLPELTRQLQAEHGTAQVLDARRPKAPQEGGAVGDGWSGRSLLGLGFALVFVAD